jgi:GNAT superfamily N-acetyltransferase
MTTTLVRTRHTTTHDVAALVAMHRRCSPDTLHRRFHVPVHDVPPRVVEQLVAPPGGWSIVAEQCDDLVGHGSAGPLSPGVVEVGLVVEDAHQGTGIGALLIRDLAVEASRRGFSTMVCLAQPDNDSVVRTVRRAGLDCVPVLVDGLLEVSVALPARRSRLRRPA